MSLRNRNRKFLRKSGFEDRAIDLFKKHKVKADYEADKIEYVIRANYKPDFKCTDKDGNTFYIETKGYFDVEAVKKMKAVKETNPDLDVRMWFMSDKKIPGRKKMKYSDWCEKYGYKYHIGESFPKHWFT